MSSCDLSGETSEASHASDSSEYLRSHACDCSEYLTWLAVADRPRRARAGVFSRPCFPVDRPSATDGRHIPGGAPGGRPDRLRVFPTRPRSGSRWCEVLAFLLLA